MRRICNLLIVVLMLSLVVAAVGCAAEFEMSSLDVSPEVCLPGDTVVVSAILVNTGNAKGDYAAELLVNGAMEQTQTFTLEPRSSQSLSFTLMEGEPGRYSVQLAELTASFTVLKPAEFRVVDLDIAPNPVKVGEPATITVTIENVGEAEGTYHATLLLDGGAHYTSDVTLAAGVAKTELFMVSKDSPGSYSIQIGGQQAILEVIQPVRLETGTFLVRELTGGKAKLKIENELDLDAVVVLSSPEEPTIPLLAFYVQSHDSYRATRIPAGTYVLYVALGRDWDNDSKKFLSIATYKRFVDEYYFKSTKRRYTIWTIFLGGGDGEPARVQLVTEDEFPRLE